WRFHFRRAPGELNLDWHVSAGKVGSREIYQFSCHDPVLEVLGLLEERILRHCQHPLNFAHALFRVDQIGHPNYIQPTLQHPVEASKAGIQRPMLDVARHFLRTDEQAFNLRIVGCGKVGARTGVDAQTGASEQTECGFLQTSLGNAQTKLHRCAPASSPRVGAPRESSWVKQDLDPVWQTLPSPNTRTRSSTVSRSQSVHAATTSSRLPEVSPLVHRLFLVRL